MAYHLNTDTIVMSEGGAICVPVKWVGENTLFCRRIDSYGFNISHHCEFLPKKGVEF
jgi:hypothetical protein